MKRMQKIHHAGVLVRFIADVIMIAGHAMKDRSCVGFEKHYGKLVASGLGLHNLSGMREIRGRV